MLFLTVTDVSTTCAVVIGLCGGVFDSEDEDRTGCRNVSHCQQQQSCSRLVHPDDQTQPTFEMTPGFKPLTVYIFVVVKIFFFLRNMLVITVAMFLTKIYTNRKSAQILVHKQ